MDDDVLFDALETTCKSNPIDDDTGHDEDIVVVPSGMESVKDCAHLEQIVFLTNQLQNAAAECQAVRVQSAAETSMLRQQLQQQQSVAKHMKQMLKNISDKYTALQVEHKALKQELNDKNNLLLSSHESVHAANKNLAELNQEITRLSQVEATCSALNDTHEELKVECEQWKSKAKELQAVQEQNKQLHHEMDELLRQHELANKRTHQIIKELRKTLQEERNKPPPPPVVLPSPPLQVKCIYPNDAQEVNEIIQEFALRIEELLQHNAMLTERARFAEENTRLLSMDLERKRLLLRQLCMKMSSDDKLDVYALALTKAIQIERLETAESLLYRTLVENLELKKSGHTVLSMVDMEEPQLTLYKAL